MARKSQKNAKGPRRRTSASPQGSSSYRAKVRMYRQGLGDCFLISLPRSDSDRPYRVLIDCGVILGTADASTKMTEVVENIIAATQGEIDLLLATHEHWDHVSGFVQAKDAFDKLKVHEVWLGWTENRNDPLTQKLKAQRDAALASLRLGLSRLQLAGDEPAAEAVELGGLLEFFGAAKGASTEDALASVREMSSNLRFCLPSDAPVEPSGTGARFYVLGPPHDEKLLRKINPSARDKETYGLAVDGFQLFMAGAGTALDSNDRGRPFDGQYEIPFSYAKEMAFFQQQYWTPADATDNWRLIDSHGVVKVWR